MLGASRIQALAVAAELRIPDLLAERPRSSAEIASLTSVNQGALHRLLRFLAADNWVSILADGNFGMTAQLEPLTSDSPTGLRGYVLSTASRGWAIWSRLGDSVKTGKPAFDEIFGRSYFEEQRANAESLAQFDAALAPGAAESGEALARIVEPAECVVDLGCGSGALLLEILRAWPAARGVAFDGPEALSLARERFAREGLGQRVAMMSGDFFVEAPYGGDLYVLSLVLHDWDDEKCKLILRNCVAAMQPGARLAIIERVVDEDPRVEPQAAYADLGMLVMTGGRERTLAEFMELVESSGLQYDGVERLGTNRDCWAIMASRR